MTNKMKDFFISPSGVLVKTLVFYPTICIFATMGILFMMTSNSYLAQLPVILLLLALYPLCLGVSYICMWDDIKWSRGFYATLRLIIEPRLSEKYKDKGIFFLISTIWYIVVIISLVVSLVAIV